MFAPAASITESSDVHFVKSGDSKGIVALENRVRLYDLYSSEFWKEVEIPKFKMDKNLCSLSYDDRLVQGITNRQSGVWNLETGTGVTMQSGDSGRVTISTFSADNTRLLTGYSQRVPELIWDIETQKTVLELNGHNDLTYDAQFHQNQNLVALVSWDKSVLIHDTVSGDLVHKISKAHPNNLKSVTFTQEYGLFTGSNDQKVKHWDMRKNYSLVEAMVQPKIPLGLEAASNNFMAVHFAGSVKVINLESKEELWSSPGFIGSINNNGNVVMTCVPETKSRTWQIHNSNTRFKTAKSARK